ncbi:elongation factor G [Flavobacterium aciduliphilum]|uniref:Elongation factor G n=1 Tax=Flavobacterium aciduliphilum TaxID=1101402 RepID=A0A328YBY5_9FLAO|nr:elongation factor G [Flavobacterium aciduliphilum]RAR70613.1 translation elongation factor 2 (EF-2/EF-G) [Flavobacterium aciduliphilum]
MANFDSKHVKNVVLVGHTGSGKTTLIESMLFESGLINRRGTVLDKNTVADYTEIEHEKGKTFFSKLVNTKWKGYKINLLDTPGYDDFAGEIVGAMRVADCGVMVLNATMGVEVGTDIIWEYTEAYKLPMLLAVNHLDNEKSDFDKSVREAKNHFGTNVVVVQYPVNQGESFNAIVDVLNMVLYQYLKEGGKPEKLPIPDEEKERANQLHQELIETIAGNDETLMERYFEKGELDEDEMKLGLHHSLIKHEIFPIFCVSAKQNMGCGRIMSFIDNVCPSAYEMPKQKTIEGAEIECTETADAALFIYKTLSEPHIGDLSFFKVLSGKIKVGDELTNENTGQIERINQLFEVEGSKRTAVNELVAGDIGATLKLKDTHTNNTLHEKGKPIEIVPIEFPNPTLTVAVEGTKKGEEEKLSMALHQLVEEDPTIRVEVSAELRQTLIHCHGELHLAVIRWKLENALKLSVEFKAPKIPYRETIRKAAETIYRHKKQSGGAGQFAEVAMKIEPWYEEMPDPVGYSIRGKEVHDLPWGGKLVYYNCIVGGAIDARFHPSILKGIMEKMSEGPLTGSYVRDIRVIIFDGKMHTVDSNDLAFKTAGMMAFKENFHNADPLLLEPFHKIVIHAPEELTGAIMSTIQSHRAMVEGMDAEGHFSIVKALVPYAETQQLTSDLRALTQGRARFTLAFSHYDEVPFDLQKKLVSESKQELELV